MDSDPIESARPEITCLIANDNEPVLDALGALLRVEGIEVVGLARTGVEALRLLSQRPASVIVLDQRLPDLNGLDVARRAAEIIRKRTAIIIYTGYADRATVSEALDAGARGVVLKDATPENLLHAMSVVSAGQIYLDPRLRLGRREDNR